MSGGRKPILNHSSTRISQSDQLPLTSSPSELEGLSRALPTVEEWLARVRARKAATKVRIPARVILGQLSADRR